MKNLIIILLLSVNVSFSQDTLTVFDRPGVADSPYITDKQNWQIESGFAYSQIGGFSEAILPSSMLRKSFFGGNELRFAFNYEPQMMAIIKKHMANNYDPIAIGIKRKVLKENRFIPETAILINTYYPMQLVNKIKKSDVYNFEMNLLFQNNLNSKVAINYNIGTNFSNFYKKGILNYSFCLIVNLSEKSGLFVETFGYKTLSDKNNELGWDVGFVFNPNPNSQIDFSFITNYYSDSSYGSLLLGYSFILKTKTFWK